MNVVGVQLDIVWEDKPANLNKARTLLESASIPPNSLIVLPEMMATGFSMNVDTVCESSAGETEGFLSRMAADFGCCVLAGVATRNGNRLGRNEAVVFDADGQEIARYSKLHPFSFGDENKYFMPGEGICTFMWQGFKVSPFICYDLRFPEPFRTAVDHGATLFVVIANWPQQRDLHWEIFLQARAIENQAYVVGINRCGSDPKNFFSGGSRIIDPTGQTVVCAGSEETIIQADLKPDIVADYRERFPTLADRRKSIGHAREIMDARDCVPPI